MNFWDRAKIAIATFRRLGGIELPDAGRSSDETLSGSLSSFLTQFGSVSPVIDFEMLAVLKNLWLYNPDVSQYIANIVNLGNPGHSLSVEAASDSTAEAALNRLNESASRLYPQGCGVDGLINQYLTSVAWSGAISSEDVVNFAARRVEKVVLVPVEQIRFRYNGELDIYEAYQRSLGSVGSRGGLGRDPLGLIRLNPETYRYFALSTVENSPYAKPPATAAVEAIIDGQQPLMKNIRFMAEKIGLMGLVSAAVTPPPRKPNEDEDLYNARATKYLKSVKTALDGNFNNGLIATFKDQKIEHTPVTTGAQGVYDVNRMSEEQVFSGLGAMPGFHGRTDSTTETFADVVYYLLLAQMQNMQRPVKRRMESTYRLDLRLAGIDVASVSLSFNEAHSRNAKAEAETEEIRQRVIFQQVEKGLISPDEAAQELGIESWYDATLLDSAAAGFGSLGAWGENHPVSGSRCHPSFVRRGAGNGRTINLNFDKRVQKYRFQPEVIQLASGGDDVRPGQTVVPFIKKKALRAYN